jgi:hypothetical protein
MSKKPDEIRKQLDFVSLTDEEHINKWINIQKKFESNSILTTNEESFFCRHCKFEYLLEYPFCLDQYFQYVYLLKLSLLFPNDEYLTKHLHLFPNGYTDLSEKDSDLYKKLVNDWTDDFNKDSLLKFVKVETKKELKILSRENSNISILDLEDKKFQILAWSKYRFIMVKKIFEKNIKSNEYKLSLNGQEIVFGYDSLYHIYTGHFGLMMKPYNSQKSHFFKDFPHSEIHSKLENIFIEIDKSKLYSKNAIEAIHLRYNGSIYKIFCKKEVEKINSKYRLTSFFPVEYEQLLKELKIKFEEKRINNNLSIFVKIFSYY